MQGTSDSRTPVDEFKAKELEVGGVVVYPDRAEVKRLIRATLRRGENDVVVNQLPSVVDPKSLRSDIILGPSIIQVIGLNWFKHR